LFARHVFRQNSITSDRPIRLKIADFTLLDKVFESRTKCPAHTACLADPAASKQHRARQILRPNDQNGHQNGEQHFACTNIEHAIGSFCRGGLGQAKTAHRSLAWSAQPSWVITASF